MDALMAVLRIVHILAGVFWAGGAFVSARFLTPTAAELGPDGSKFMQRFIQRGFSMAMTATAVLTTLSGIWLYGRISGFRTAWVSTGTGLFLTIGGIAGILALIIGFVLISRASIRLGKLGREMQAAGGPPNPTLLAEMQSLRQRMSRGGMWTAILLLIAVIGMAVAQYAWFKL